MAREPNVAADETAETLAMVTIRFSRYSASRCVATNSRIATEIRFAESPFPIFQQSLATFYQNKAAVSKGSRCGAAARLQLATAGPSGIAAQKVFVLRLNDVPGEARYACKACKPLGTHLFRQV
jgi:hypothetical protein